MGERKCTVGRSAMARGQFEIAGDGQAVIFKPNSHSEFTRRKIDERRKTKHTQF